MNWRMDLPEKLGFYWVKCSSKNENSTIFTIVWIWHSPINEQLCISFMGDDRAEYVADFLEEKVDCFWFGPIDPPPFEKEKAHNG